MAEKNPGVSDSEFHMWRALFAFAVMDKVLSLEEQKLLGVYLQQVPFSYRQMAILAEDFKNPPNAEAMYSRITSNGDRLRFCTLARALAWCEGDMDRQEELLLRKMECLRGSAELKGSRNHPHLNTYYNEYEKAGIVGLVRTVPVLEMHL